MKLRKKEKGERERREIEGGKKKWEGGKRKKSSPLYT